MSPALTSETGEGLAVVHTIAELTRYVDAQSDSSRLGDIVRCSDDAILSSTTKGVIRTWNPGAERTYGYTAGEILGRSIHILAPSDRPDEVNDIGRG